MKREWKTRLCLLVVLCMAALFLPQGLAAQEQPQTPTNQSEETAAPAAPQNQPAPAAAANNGEEYSPADVGVINAIIDTNGLKADKDSPVAWAADGLVTWNTETPKRITELNLILKHLTGKLDVSGLTALTELECSYNQLTELNVNGLISLTYLGCNTNQLTELNVSGLTALRTLYCSYNALTSLNLNGLTSLTYFSCDKNKIIALDLSGLSSDIVVYSCDVTQLTDPSGNTLSFGETQEGLAQILQYNQNGSKQVKIQAYPKADYEFESWGNEKTDNPYIYQMNGSATITPVFVQATESRYNAEDLAALEKFITDHQLNGKAGIRQGFPDTYTMATWRDKRLMILNLNFNISGNLKVSGFPELVLLNCERSGVSSLEISDLLMLQEVKCNNNQLTSIKLTNLPELNKVDCSDNQLTSLTLTNLSALQKLDCYGNQLTTLSLSGLSKLNTLNCSGSQVTSLTLTNLGELQNLDCSGNQLATLSLSGLSKLNTLNCSGSQVTSLTLANLPGMRNLNCSENRLTALDLSGLNLQQLNCSGNQLTSLDVSGSTNLSNFIIENNIPLSSLKLPGGKSIEIQITGLGQALLKSFDFSTGKGTYVAKSQSTEIGYGEGTWHNLVGCTATAEGIEFDLTSQNTVSADLLFERRPVSADPDQGEIVVNGVAPGGQVEKGETINFTVAPILTGASVAHENDVQYMPESWSVNPSGTFENGNYTQQFSTADMDAGEHTLIVVYRVEKYCSDTNVWDELNQTITKEFKFTLVDSTGGGGGDTPSGGGDTPSGGGDTPSGGGDTPSGGGDTPSGGGETPGGGGTSGGSETPGGGGTSGGSETPGGGGTSGGGQTPGGGTSGSGQTPGGNGAQANASGSGQNGAQPGTTGTDSTTPTPGTGDSSYAWYIIGLALAGGAVVLLVRKKKTA